MKILVIWLSYTAIKGAARESSKSGGDTHIIEVSKRWSSLGHKVIVFTSFSGMSLLSPHEAQLEIHLIRLPFEDFLSRNLFGVTILYLIRALLASIANVVSGIDVVVSSSHFVCDLLPAWILSRRYRCKNATYFHGWLFTREKKVARAFSTVHNVFSLLLLRLSSDLIYVINAETRRLCLQFNIKEERIVMTSNGVDLIGCSLKSKEFDGCFLGRLDKIKGIFDLLRIWRIVCNQKPDAILTIVGGGLGSTPLQNGIKNLRLQNNVKLRGTVVEKEKCEILSKSRLFIYPSYLESWCISIAEAMACGLPVVAYNLPVYKEVFEDKLISIPIGDVDAMAKQIVFLLDNPQTAEKIGEVSRVFVKKYSWSIVAERELSEITCLMGSAYGR